MKNIFRFLMAAVIFFGAVSCAKEDISSSLAGGEVEVTFTANLPELGTRAYADGAKAGILFYNIYEANTDNKLDDLCGSVESETNTFKFQVPMIKGMTYDIVLWAQNKNCEYYRLVGKQVTAVYEGKNANDDTRDAFYCFKKNFSPTAPAVVIPLTRPFAQLNVATSDLDLVEDSEVTITTTTVTVKTYTGFNIATGDVTGNQSEITFAATDAPFKAGETLKTGYDYLSMNYILVPKEGMTVDPVYTFNNNKGVVFENTSYGNVPLKQNYRTNILGALLTKQTEIEVEILPDFGGAKEVAIWDGVAIEDPVINGDIYEVHNAAQLAHIANLVNGTLTREAVAANDLAGKTVKLMNDIYLANEEWTPIGNIHPHHFKGTFDGNGKTVYGLKVTEHNGAHPKGLIGIVSGNPTVRNLTIDGATVAMKNDHTGDFYAAGLIGTFYGNLTVDGVTVKNSTFVGNNKVAGLLAHDGVCSNLNINNCHILNCNISSANLTDGGNVGGLLGLFQGAANGEFKITNSSVKESTIVGINSSNNGKRANGQFVACVSSKENQTLVIEDCVVEGNDFNQTIDGSAPVTYVGPYDNLFVGGERNGDEELPGSVVIDALPYPHASVATWAEFTAALAAGESYIVLTADITHDANYQLQKDVVIDLNGKSMTLPMINIHNKVTIKNGTINGKVYARKNSEIVFNNVKFSGDNIGDNLSTEGHLAIQGGCKSLYAKDCLFSPTSVSGSQTKPLSFEGGSTIMKFEGCEFKSSPYKKQVYFNSLSATGSLDFTNCNFNNKTPNIMFAAACPLTNLTMSGTTKLSSVTLETNRAKDAVTAEDLAYLRESLIANNSMSSVRLFYAGGSSEYIR